MSRFHYSGRNWENREWYVAEPIRAIGVEISRTWPDGNGSLDGTVASERHDEINPWSDHRPHPFTGRGIVRAIDIWVPSHGVGHMFSEILRQLPTVNYVLFGDTNHGSHVHVSTLSSHDNDARKVYMFTQAEVRELKEMYAESKAANSDLSGFTRVAIDLVRRERDNPLHKPTDHGGGGLDYGDRITLARP